MKCLVCGSDDTYWVSTTLDNETEGYETHACSTCRGNTDYGIEILQLVFTGKDNVFPFEKE